MTQNSKQKNVMAGKLPALLKLLLSGEKGTERCGQVLSIYQHNLSKICIGNNPEENLKQSKCINK